MAPTRLPHPWDSPGKNTGVGCHFLLQCMKAKSESEVVQSCPTPSDPMDCSLPGSSVHGIFQARVLEWGAIAFSGKGFEPIKFQLCQLTCHLGQTSLPLEPLLLNIQNGCSESPQSVVYWPILLRVSWVLTNGSCHFSYTLYYNYWHLAHYWYLLSIQIIFNR